MKDVKHYSIVDLYTGEVQAEIQDIAWAAGLIDGDGCIRIHRTKTQKNRRSPWFSLVVVVSMTSKKTLEKLYSIFGVGTLHSKNCGIRPKHYKPMYTWNVSAKEAGWVLNLIYPFLVTKKKEAKLALLFDDLPSGQNGKNPMKPLVLHQKQRLYRLISNHKKLNETV